MGQSVKIGNTGFSSGFSSGFLYEITVVSAVSFVPEHDVSITTSIETNTVIISSLVYGPDVVIDTSVSANLLNVTSFVPVHGDRKSVV